MAEFPAFPVWTDAYLADTTHLTTLEHGAYLLLLMAMWRTGESRLPSDDVKLARFARLTPGQWRRVKPSLMAFFRADGDWITQGRLTDEYNAVRQHSRKQSDKAKARWLKEKETTDAAAMPDGCRSDAPLPLPLPLPKETTTAPPDGYAFEGEVIRLTRGDFSTWAESFSNLHLRAELVALDAWANETLSAAERKRWFTIISAVLAKKNREAVRKNAPGAKEWGTDEWGFSKEYAI